MKRFLIALSVLTCVSAPAFADVCSGASEAATREALKSADARGLRTATVRVSCEGKAQTFVIHRVGGANSSTVTVREVRRQPANGVIDVAQKPDFEDTSPARLIRVRD